MKIVVGINSLSSGGAEVFTAELVVAYAKKGNEVSLITYVGVLNEKGNDLRDYLIKNNVKIIDLSTKSKLFLPYFYIKAILNLKPQLVHSNLEQSDLLLIITKFFYRNAKYIRTLHNIKAFNKYPLWLHKMLFKFYDKNVGCSEFTKTHFEIRELRKEIIAINNGVDMVRINHKAKSESSLSKDENKTTFVVIGTSQKRFGEYQKGHDLIFKAFKNIKEKYQVIFLGDLENISADFPVESLNPYFNFVGVTSDISQFLKISDYILAASRFEGLPISTIEGVCSGLPLVCSNIEGFLPFNKDSTLYFENENLEDLTHKLQKAINLKDKYKILGLKNKESYSQQFDIDEVATKYLNLL